MATTAALALLFIGNSLTAANDLPSMLAAMGKASGIPIRCEVVVRPGFSLEDHWNERAARDAIAHGGWSHVILQQGPSALPESRVLLNEYVRRFDREIRSTGATTALFAVWPEFVRRRDFQRVSASYESAAALVKGELFPAGDAWMAAWRRDPALALYGPDGFHPSRVGSYLAALVIFERLTGRLPDPAAVPGISRREADICRAAVLSIASRRNGKRQSAIGNRQSAIGNRQSAIGNRQSANDTVYRLPFTVYCLLVYP